MSWIEQVRELASLKGSVGLALVAFLAATGFHYYRGIDFADAALGAGVLYAAISVGIVQALARLSGERRDYALLALGSLAVLVVMTGPEVFAGNDSNVSWPIVIAIWAGISLAATALVLVYRRT